MTTKSNNKESIVQREDREQRFMPMNPLASSRIKRETAKASRQEEFRAKGREKDWERTKQKEKRYNQHSGI
jgi:hypothetical protein